MQLNSTIYIHDCKEDDFEVKLHKSPDSRWLSVVFNGGDAHLAMFFRSQEDQEAVLGKLHTELDILQPKF